MNLAELAFGCFVYAAISDFDRSYLEFLDATGGPADLDNEAHRKALLVWLNSWGCRQFAIEYHQRASNEILSWHGQFEAILAPTGRNLWELTEQEMTSVGQAYGSLAKRVASHRGTPHGLNQQVSFGPTGAAKILFALRPEALVPWDDAIREELGFGPDSDSYVGFLQKVRVEMDCLSEQCQRAGFAIDELPEKLGRPRSTVPKLIDEYYWVTITKKCEPPGSVTLQRWAEWSQF